MAISQQEIQKKLDALKKATANDALVAEALCKFIDASNAGQPTSKEELLLSVSEELRNELSDHLNFTEALLDLGRHYKKSRQ